MRINETIAKAVLLAAMVVPLVGFAACYPNCENPKHDHSIVTQSVAIGGFVCLTIFPLGLIFRRGKRGITADRVIRISTVILIVSMLMTIAVAVQKDGDMQLRLGLMTILTLLTIPVTLFYGAGIASRIQRVRALYRHSRGKSVWRVSGRLLPVVLAVATLPWGGNVVMAEEQLPSIESRNLVRLGAVPMYNSPCVVNGHQVRFWVDQVYLSWFDKRGTAQTNVGMMVGAVEHYKYVIGYRYVNGEDLELKYPMQMSMINALKNWKPIVGYDSWTYSGREYETEWFLIDRITLAKIPIDEQGFDQTMELMVECISRDWRQFLLSHPLDDVKPVQEME